MGIKSSAKLGFRQEEILEHEGLWELLQAREVQSADERHLEHPDATVQMSLRPTEPFVRGTFVGAQGHVTSCVDAGQ